jgi:hypothetical protein
MEIPVSERIKPTEPTKHNKSADHLIERPIMTKIHQLRTMDFVADYFIDGYEFRVLIITDN